MDEALTASIVTRRPVHRAVLIHAHADPGGAVYQHHRRPPRAASPSDRRRTRAAVVTVRVSRCRTAYHFGQAAVYKSADKAVEYAARAGDRAGSALAFEHAAHWYDVALRAMDFVASNTMRPPAKRAARQTRTQLLRGRAVGIREERLRSRSEPARSRRAREAGRTARPPCGNGVLADGCSSAPEVRR